MKKLKGTCLGGIDPEPAKIDEVKRLKTNSTNSDQQELTIEPWTFSLMVPSKKAKEKQKKANGITNWIDNQSVNTLVIRVHATSGKARCNEGYNKRASCP